MTDAVISLAGWFCIAFGVVLLTAAIMNRLSKNFYTQDVVLRKFNILDLQFPAEPKEIRNLIRGIYQLPKPGQPRRVLRALKAQLYVDFLFMPAAYGAIFILCEGIAQRLNGPGHTLFIILAWIQVISLLADVYENSYLLARIRPDVEVSGNTSYKLYKGAVAGKWCCALLATVCALAVVFYFWVTGAYHPRFFGYGWVIAGEILLFALAQKTLKKKDKQ